MNQLVTRNRSHEWAERHWRESLMKTMKWLPAFLVFAVLSPGSALSASAEEGVALAIVYDTSGSMREPVAGKDGKQAAKYVVANKALVSVADRIEAFATNTAAGAARKVDCALFTFQGDSARAAIPLGPLNADALRNWARSFNAPTGNTPLGNSLSIAWRTVLNSPLSRKHVLVITDGMNTAGPTPQSVLPNLQRAAKDGSATVSAHFIAFDVDAKVFDGVKKLGATVVGAQNEAQLSAQLQFILQKKILLEDEDPPAKK
jgi:hypothetical protein